MISLQDQIQKFEKLVYNPQLQQFVTVDQMFTGGGITMQSIIQETNFIVEELKKMNAMFKNYCKLNDKIYTKITEHELSVHSQQARLNALTGSVDRKLDDSLKKIKELHEDTLNQNQKSRTYLSQVLDPIKKQLGQKVDEATFSAMVKKYLEEENQDENPSNLEGHGQVSGAQGIASDGGSASPYPRKKGKLSYNQFYKFREELDAKTKASEDQISQLEKDGGEAKTLLFKYIPQINNLSADLEESRTNIYKLQMAQTDNFNATTTAIKNLSAQLNSKLNDQVWKDKFQTFQERQIKPIVQQLEQRLRHHEQRMDKNMQENINKFKQVDAQIMKNKNEVDICKKNIDWLKDEMKNTKKTIDDHEQQFKTQLNKLGQSLELLSQEATKLLNDLSSSTQKDIKEINSALANIVNTVSDAVVKVVNKRFDLQLKAIDKNIRDGAEATKQVRIDITLLEQQTKNIKQILSQKANFSDIVYHVEKKADKEDFKQLQTRLHETSQQLYSNKKMSESVNISSRLDRNDNTNNRKTPSVNKSVNIKTLAGPQYAHKTQRRELDSGTKLFMCGMQGHLFDTRKSWTSSARRRNQKSSTAVVSDFIL